MSLDLFYGYRRARSRVALENGSLGRYADQLATVLARQGYSHTYGLVVLRAAATFGDWLTTHGYSLSDIDEHVVSDYAAELGCFPCGKRRHGMSGMKRIREVLPGHRKGATTDVPWLADFDTHLADVAGLAPLTRKAYIRVIRRLSDFRFSDSPPDWTAITPKDIGDFVQREAVRMKSLNVLCGAITAFSKFLIARGLRDPGFLGAVPRIRRWRLSSLPRYASEEEIAMLLEVCRDGSTMGLRDEALLVVLFRLGLRAGEVARLELDDFGWRDGTVLVRATKTRRERTLPLPEDVGLIVGRYLREARPTTTHRGIFLRHLAPNVPLTPGGVVNVARQREAQAGITAPKLGSHLLRHSAATYMVRRGASFKEVADVLGHRSLSTTHISAKLDTAALARVAMPLPGSE